MPLTSSTPLGLAVVQTIEFVGIGPAGKKRTIDSFEYLVQPPLNRVNVVAPPEQDWMTLFKEWSLKWSLHVSMSVRTGMTTVLTLNEVIPAHFSVQMFQKVPLALMSFASKQVIVAWVKPVIASSWDRYLPVSARNGAPLQRIG